MQVDVNDESKLLFRALNIMSMIHDGAPSETHVLLIIFISSASLCALCTDVANFCNAR